MTPYEIDLAHLVKLAQTPGWKAYAWHKAKELEKCSNGLYQNLTSDLTKAIRERQESGSLQKHHATGS